MSLIIDELPPVLAGDFSLCISGLALGSHAPELNPVQYKAFMHIQSKLVIGLSLLMVAIIALLTLTPASAPQLGSFEHTDKTYHALAFAGLTLPMALFRPNWLFVAVPIHATFGSLIEIIQPFVGRDCSFAN
jgi:hypothetical protein